MASLSRGNIWCVQAPAVKGEVGIIRGAYGMDGALDPVGVPLQHLLAGRLLQLICVLLNLLLHLSPLEVARLKLGLVLLPLFQNVREVIFKPLPVGLGHLRVEVQLAVLELLLAVLLADHLQGLHQLVCYSLPVSLPP